MIKPVLIMFVRLLTGARLRWRGDGPSLRQSVYFANHTSNLDALVIWAALPRILRDRTRPVAARDYWSQTRLRRYLAERVLKAVLIERRKVTVKSNPLVPMLAALDAGSSLILFPEGGRRADGEVGDFKGGLHHLARLRPAVEFVPTWVDNVNRVLPKGEILPVPFLGSVTMGRPLILMARESRDCFLARARREVENLRVP